MTGKRRVKIISITELWEATEENHVMYAAASTAAAATAAAAAATTAAAANVSSCFCSIFKFTACILSAILISNCPTRSVMYNNE